MGAVDGDLLGREHQKGIHHQFARHTLFLRVDRLEIVLGMTAGIMVYMSVC